MPKVRSKVNIFKDKICVSSIAKTPPRHPHNNCYYFPSYIPFSITYSYTLVDYIGCNCFICPFNLLIGSPLTLSLHHHIETMMAFTIQKMSSAWNINADLTTTISFMFPFILWFLSILYGDDDDDDDCGWYYVRILFHDPHLLSSYSSHSHSYCVMNKLCSFYCTSRI